MYLHIIVKLLKTREMNKKLFLLLVSACLYTLSYAAGYDTKDPGADGKKEELSGTVIHSETKKPLEGVTVTAVLASKKEKIVLTNEDGGFSFDELKPGVYKFVFEKSGYKKATKEKIVVKTDEAFQIKIEMTEADQYDIMPSPFNIGGVY